MDEKKTAKKVAARLVVDLSRVRERIRALKVSGCTLEDFHTFREELSSLVVIRSIQVL